MIRHFLLAYPRLPLHLSYCKSGISGFNNFPSNVRFCSSNIGGSNNVGEEDEEMFGKFSDRSPDMPPIDPTELPAAAPDTLNDPDLHVLLDNNKRWVEKKNSEDTGFFERLGAGQAPKYFYIGCSDSRVPANEILGLEAGTVFVHRNVGNMMQVGDINALTALEYAVEHLQVDHIIVTGHYDCGAVKAATQKADLGLIEHWLRGIRDVYRIHQLSLDMLMDDEERHRKLVELNVVEQCLNVYKNGVVQRRRIRSYGRSDTQGFTTPRIHGMVFDPKIGILKKLPINFKRQLENFSHIYDLYDIPDARKFGLPAENV